VVTVYKNCIPSWIVIETELKYKCDGYYKTMYGCSVDNACEWFYVKLLLFV